MSQSRFSCPFFTHWIKKKTKKQKKSPGIARWDGGFDTFALLRPNESTLYGWRRQPESTRFLQTHRSSSFERFSTACARSPHSQSNFRAGRFNPHRRHGERWSIHCTWPTLLRRMSPSARGPLNRRATFVLPVSLNRDSRVTLRADLRVFNDTAPLISWWWRN